MIVLGINKILNWCQITSGGRTYTCPTKLIDGKLVFHFKKEWHSVAEFVSDHAEELVSEGGKIFSRPFKKQEVIVMRCANCGNEDENTLWDEGDTIYCSRCTHRTRTSDGEEDLVECPHCHEMRDSKAYYCRHCNMPF